MAQWFSFSTHQYASFKPKRVLKKQVDTVGKNYGDSGRAVTNLRENISACQSKIKHQILSTNCYIYLR